MKRHRTFLLQIMMVMALLGLVFFWGATSYDWLAVWEYRQLFFMGWIVTVELSLASLFLSLAIGLLFASTSKSKIGILKALSKTCIETIRGTPLLVQLLFFYYVIGYQVGLENRYVAGVLVLSTFHAAYIAEMIRAGLDAVGATQRESAQAIGLSRWQAFRFVLFPQAVRRIIPPLAGQFASIVKDSSLLSIIGISEMSNAAQQVNSATYSTLESFLPLAVAYLILTLPISLWSKQLERRFTYET